MQKTQQELKYLFNGVPAKESNIIGRCKNYNHRGWMSRTLLKNHECIEKGCRYFEKVNPEYWNGQERQKIAAADKRREAKERKKFEAEREAFIRALFIPYSYVHMTSVQETDFGLRIAYIYDQDQDLTEVAQAVKQKYNCSVLLKPANSRPDVKQMLIRNRQRVSA